MVGEEIVANSGHIFAEWLELVYFLMGESDVMFY